MSLMNETLRLVEREPTLIHQVHAATWRKQGGDEGEGTPVRGESKSSWRSTPHYRRDISDAGYINLASYKSEPGYFFSLSNKIFVSA
jgi:hypothetical protein